MLVVSKYVPTLARVNTTFGDSVPAVMKSRSAVAPGGNALRRDDAPAAMRIHREPVSEHWRAENAVADGAVRLATAKRPDHHCRAETCAWSR